MYEEITHTVALQSIESHVCQSCGEPLYPYNDGIAKCINHYVQLHGYKLLHVGPQTFEGREGPWYCTTAVLGSKETPPDNKVQDIVF